MKKWTFRTAVAALLAAWALFFEGTASLEVTLAASLPAAIFLASWIGNKLKGGAAQAGLVLALSGLVLAPAGCVSDGQVHQLDPQRAYQIARTGYNGAAFALAWLRHEGKIDEETYAKILALKKVASDALETLRKKAEANDPLGLDDALELFNGALASFEMALDDVRPPPKPEGGAPAE